MSPLIGRTVRFDGKHKNLEGVVIAIEPAGHMIDLVLEVTQHPYGITEPDGAHAIAFISFDTMQDGKMYVKPADVDADKLAIATKEFLAALDGWTDVRLGPQAEKSRGRFRLFETRNALHHLLGLPPKHQTPRAPCRHCGEPMPPPDIARLCSSTDTENKLRNCEAV